MIKAGTAQTRCAEKGHISELQKGFKLKTSKQASKQMKTTTKKGQQQITQYWPCAARTARNSKAVVLILLGVGAALGSPQLPTTANGFP